MKQSTGVRIYLWCQLEPLVKNLQIKSIDKLLTNDTPPLNPLTNDTPLKSIALKVIYVMPALQIKRRLRLWEEGNITELVNESKTIQDRLPSTNSQTNIEKLSYKFKQLMQKSNVSGALC